MFKTPVHSDNSDNQSTIPEENENWIRVTSHRKKRSKRNQPSRPFILRPSEFERSQILLNTLDNCDWDALVKKFIGTRSHYLDTKIGRSFINGLLESLNQAYHMLSDNDDLVPESINILCLGLGDPSTDESSMRQLAVLDILLSSDKRFARSRTQIYDPLLQMCSRKLIRKFGMQVLNENKEGCYRLDPRFYHFVFLPHCAPALLNNLLLTNWESHTIGRLVLYSNGWPEVRQELLASGETEDLIDKNLYHIQTLEPSLALPGKRFYLNSTSHGGEPRSFEGMRIQCFPPSKLAKLPQSVWNKMSVPHTYSDFDPTRRNKDSSERFSLDLIKKAVIPGYVDQLAEEVVHTKKQS